MDTNWDNGWLNSINLTNAVHVVTKPSPKDVEAIGHFHSSERSNKISIEQKKQKLYFALPTTFQNQ